MGSKLREIRQLSQHKAYRWFNSVTADLYVWHNGRQIERFEYSYNKPQNEHMLVWEAKNGFKHMRIDDGEASPIKNQSPMIDRQVEPEFEGLARNFRENAICIDADIYRFVMQKLYDRL